MKRAARRSGASRHLRRRSSSPISRTATSTARISGRPSTRRVCSSPGANLRGSAARADTTTSFDASSPGRLELLVAPPAAATHWCWQVWPDPAGRRAPPAGRRREARTTAGISGSPTRSSRCCPARSRALSTSRCGPGDRVRGHGAARRRWNRHRNALRQPRDSARLGARQVRAVDRRDALAHGDAVGLSGGPRARRATSPLPKLARWTSRINGRRYRVVERPGIMIVVSVRLARDHGRGVRYLEDGPARTSVRRHACRARHRRVVTCSCCLVDRGQGVQVGAAGGGPRPRASRRQRPASRELKPVIVEGPPVIEPWEELAHLHFNDRASTS